MPGIRGLCLLIAATLRGASARTDILWHIADLPLLKSAEQQQYHEDDEYQAESAAWIRSPVTAVTPPWKCSNQEQHDNDDQNGS